MWYGNLNYYIAEKQGLLYWLPKAPRSPLAWRQAKPYTKKHPDLLCRKLLPTWIAKDYYDDRIVNTYY